MVEYSFTSTQRTQPVTDGNESLSVNPAPNSSPSRVSDGKSRISVISSPVVDALQEHFDNIRKAYDNVKEVLDIRNAVIVRLRKELAETKARLDESISAHKDVVARLEKIKASLNG